MAAPFEVIRYQLPHGLDEDTADLAARAIMEWEDTPDHLSIELVIKLHHIFSRAPQADK
jgi:hypothetical protein